MTGLSPERDCGPNRVEDGEGERRQGLCRQYVSFSAVRFFFVFVMLKVDVMHANASNIIGKQVLKSVLI